MSPSERRARIRKENSELDARCKLLKISRSSIYYTPVGFDQVTIDLKHQIDWIFTKPPFFGGRQISTYLPQSGFAAGCHRLRLLMGIMGLQAINKGRTTAICIPSTRNVLYLLRALSIRRSNQVWCSNFTCIPVKNGFLYLLAIIDWAAREVLTTLLSNALASRRFT